VSRAFKCYVEPCFNQHWRSSSAQSKGRPNGGRRANRCARSSLERKVIHPAAHGLVRDRDPPLGQQILDVTKAE
jgi:hypothetical protein